MGARFGKGKGNDATQDVSLSQFVVPRPGLPTKPPTISRGNAKNDMSLWGGVVVGTSDFAPAPNAKKTGSNAWKWVAAAGAAIGVAAGAIFFIAGADDKPATKAAVVEAPAAQPAADKPAADKPATDKAAVDTPVVAPVDAKPVAATPTEAVAASAEPAADAISGVAPVIKPAKAAPKKKVVRKTVAKASAKKKAVVKKKKR